MRKVYIFERLTGQVKRFAAFMLITLLAVGNAFADYDGTGLFTKINSLDELTTGYYVVTNQDGEYAMSNQLPTTGSKFFYSEDAVFYNPAASLVWLVTVSADGITLYNEAIGAYAAYSGSGNTAYTITELTDKGRWTPSLDANGNWILENVATSGRFLSYGNSDLAFPAGIAAVPVLHAMVTTIRMNSLSTSGERLPHWQLLPSQFLQVRIIPSRRFL